MQADPTNQLFVMIADLQALTDNAKIPKSFSQCFRSCFWTIVAVGLDPTKQQFINRKFHS